MCDHEGMCKVTGGCEMGTGAVCEASTGSSYVSVYLPRAPLVHRHQTDPSDCVEWK